MEKDSNGYVDLVRFNVVAGMLLILAGIAVLYFTSAFDAHPIGHVVHQIGEAALIAGLLDLLLSSGLQVCKLWIASPFMKVDAALQDVERLHDYIRVNIEEIKTDAILSRLESVDVGIENLGKQIASLEGKLETMYEVVDPFYKQAKQKIQAEPK